MNVKAKIIKTPFGIFPAPLHPDFRLLIENCQTEEDLFLLVENKEGFINPDALNEVEARGLYPKYLKYLKRNNQSK